MTSPSQRADLTPNERKLLQRLKLAFWIVGVFFVVHALAGRASLELWPITRWAMFSKASPAGEVRTLTEIRTVDADCEQHSFSPQELYAASGYTVGLIAPALVTLSVKLEDDDARLEYQHLLTSEIEKRFGYELTSYEIWELDYTVDTSSFPHVDYTTPQQETKVMEFVVESNTSCSF